MRQDRASGGGRGDAVKLLPGEYSASARGEAVVTLLGSCVSVCLYDRENGVGGMNHFMLPQPPGKGGGGCSASSCAGSCSPRYGSCAIKLLIRRMEELGALRSRLEAKLFGAGRVMNGADIGAMNAGFAREFLKALKIPVVACDLGERFPRKVLFFPATGQAYVKRIGT